jgi:hypothetical protein
MKPETIPSDVYRLLVTKEVPRDINTEAIIKDFGAACEAMLRDALGPEQQRQGRLRLSSIGKPDRQIWHDYKGTQGEKLQGHTHIKFLFGHLTEAMLLALVKLTGHEVKDEQKKCNVAGINGHMDATIDGVTTDVKSASSYGFKKFKEGKLPYDDPFGYVGQIKAYAHSEGNSRIGWLAMDKQNGHLCWLGYDLDNLTPELEKVMGWDIEARCRHVKMMVGQEMPLACFNPIARVMEVPSDF